MKQEVEALSRLLQVHLRSQAEQPSKLPRSSTDAFAIVTVINSLRGACLLSSLTATRSTLIALQDSLSAASPGGGGEKLAILVHQASQQIFIIDKGHLLKRARERKALRLLFFAIDAEIGDEAERVHHIHPWYLESALDSLCSTLIGQDRNGEKHHNSPPIVIIGTQEENPLHGISLAGWLLGYDVVYFFKHLPCAFTPSSRVWHREQPFQDDSWRDGNDDDDAEVSRSNCLSRTRLFIIKVKLASTGEDLYQYSFPCSVISQVFMLFELREEEEALTGVQGICEAIECRLRRESPAAYPLRVSYDTVTQEHITL